MARVHMTGADKSAESPGYSHRDIWLIAGPMILSAISTPLVGLVDTALMGHQSNPVFLAAVAAGATLFSTLFMSLNFLRMGTTGIAAQAFGADDDTAIISGLTQPAVFAVTLGLCMLVLQNPVIELSVWLLGLSKAAGELTRTYFYIRVWSSPLALTNFVLIGWLIGMQNARGPLAIMLTINLSNVALGLLFVLGLQMNVDGVALATVLAEGAGLLIGLTFVRAEFRSRGLQWVNAASLNADSFNRLLNINSNLFIRSIALMFTFAFITAQGARYGDVILAANAVLLNFQLFLSYALDGIAHAAEALSGKAAGARNRQGLGLAVKRAGFWTLLLAILFTLVYALAGSAIIALLTDLSEIRTTAFTYLPWIIVLPLLSAPAFLYDGVFVGLTRSREMRVIMTGSAILVFLPVWYLSRELENHGLWLAFVLFMAVRSLAMHIKYRKLAPEPGF